MDSQLLHGGLPQGCALNSTVGGYLMRNPETANSLLGEYMVHVSTMVEVSGIA